MNYQMLQVPYRYFEEYVRNYNACYRWIQLGWSGYTIEVTEEQYAYVFEQSSTLEGVVFVNRVIILRLSYSLFRTEMFYKLSNFLQHWLNCSNKPLHNEIAHVTL